MLKTDVLIIGSGIAGATAALQLARNPNRQVMLMTRANDPHESNTFYAQGGIIGRGPDDEATLLLNDILAAGREDTDNKDYLLVRLSDTGAIFDIMGKLRQVYPNVLHLERPGLNPQSKTVERQAQLQKGALPLFCDFYEQMTGAAPDAEAMTLVDDLLVKLQRE